MRLISIKVGIVTIAMLIDKAIAFDKETPTNIIGAIDSWHITIGFLKNKPLTLDVIFLFIFDNFKYLSFHSL